ncbi:GGDEF domain-containing protein [Konateibacter massiliensis]|uniref:GGDEF domain-containing protein n=1 Tax=Konateibacter massiliensis TaxID=2002841 RepID=UPI0015D46EBC|nr:GGDEF domain-containing protein [Konateibacter massiliensis]
MFPVFIICLPLIFILPMMEVTLFNLLFVILFIYFSRTFKEYDVAFIDQTNILACFFISTVTSYAVNHARIKELTVRYQLEHACNIDDLTQVHNRRSFNKFIVDAFDNASADKFTLMLIDIDNFKDYNASYGHICGDNCLISISKIFQDFEKKYGCYIARYGGKEFVLVDSFHSPEEISFMAKELVQTVSDLNIEHIKSTHKKVTISIGISSKSTVGITNYIDLINLADDALLQAKKSGKNTVIFATHSASALRVTD